MSVGLAFFTRDWQMAFYVISAPLFVRDHNDSFGIEGP